LALNLTKRHFFRSTLLLLALAAAPAVAAETDEVTRSLGLSEEQSVTSSRFPRPASRIAENQTVITSEEIARINAHTVADVLQTLPGVQLDQLQTPGSVNFFHVLGATGRHVLVQIDGVPQNFIGSENIAWVGHIPVQMIERIEVVKGAASAAWGSALGGVVNIITKSPAADRAAGGMLSASTGRSSTRDLRAELSGSSENFGYYLTGGTISSDGLVQGNDTDFNHGFGKFSFALPNRGEATLGIDVRQDSMGLEESQRFNFHNTGANRYVSGNLSVRYPLAERLDLELNGRGGKREVENKRMLLSEPTLFFDASGKESFQGAGASLSWGDASHALKGGVEFERTDIEARELVRQLPQMNFDLSLRRLSAYLNGTYTIGKLSILPGVRLDHIDLLEDPVSYTLGATLRLTDSTLLRGYAARGYGMPVITNLGMQSGEVQRELQHVRTVQAGVESAEIPYLWLKGTLFYANVWNIQGFDGLATTLDEQVRQGVELELRSSPLQGFALTGAYNFTDARDRKSGEKLGGGESGPRQSLKLGLNYDNQEAGLTAALIGNYVKLHDLGPSAKWDGMLWDLHVTQKLPLDMESTAELFFSLRNILNSEQYQIEFRPNAPRWFEAGARYRF